MASNKDVLISPVGKLVHPHLNVARDFQGDGKFAYDTLFDVEGDEGREMEALILARAQDHAKRSGARSPLDMSKVILEALDSQGELMPDVTRFKFKARIIMTKNGPWDRKPAFYKADGTAMIPEPQLGSGSIVQIAYTIYEWFFAKKPGVTLEPEGVLIHELKSGGGAIDRSSPFRDVVAKAKQAVRPTGGDVGVSGDF